MNTDFGTALNLQPGLNPWLVVLLSSIAGLLAFAVCNAVYVLHTRHRRLATKLASPVAMRIRNTIVATAIALAVVLLVLSIPGPKLVEGRGWLSGDDLFSVTSRAGFVARYPNANREARKGDPILQLVRDAGPEEIAEATSRRALLAQDLEFTRLEILRVDPVLLAAQATEKGQLDDLLERRRGLIDSQAKARYELDQVESSFKAASSSLTIASRPDVAGLFSKDEVTRRQERVAVLRSRRAELRERVAQLAGEQKRQRSMAAASDETQIPRVNMGGSNLAQVDRDIAQARERVQAALQAIELDKVRAERQRERRIRQIELQIGEQDQLLNAGSGALDVRAPWDGLIGFREPSPASARLGNRPLLVLYKPGSISVKIQVPEDRAGLEGAHGVAASMQALIPEAAGSTFAGKITHGTRLPDGTAELQIVGDPPEAAIRELATGSSVPIQVVIRRLNPLAAAGIGWIWWLAIVVVLGAAFSEGRLWWLRWRMRGVEGTPAQSLRAIGPRFDWGGDPDEFLEYVVGVGIVPRKLRVESTDDTRRREQPLAAITKVRGSLQN